MGLAKEFGSWNYKGGRNHGQAESTCVLENSLINYR